MAITKTQNDPIHNIINSLSAEMVGMSIPEYVKTHEELVNFLCKIRDKVENSVVDSMKTYTKAYKIKGILSSLCCYCFNNDYKEWEKVIEIENIIGDKLIKFIKKYKKITPNQRKLGKYILWKYSYRRENKTKIIRDLLNADMLRKDDKGNYFLIGFHLSVGDNTFGITTDNKQQYRKYVPVCCFMAIGVSRFMTFCPWQESLKNEDVPMLEDYYHRYYVGNYKRGVKIALNWKDRDYIVENYCS